MIENNTNQIDYTMTELEFLSMITNLQDLGEILLEYKGEIYTSHKGFIYGTKDIILQICLRTRPYWRNSIQLSGISRVKKIANSDSASTVNLEEVLTIIEILISSHY